MRFGGSRNLFSEPAWLRKFDPQNVKLDQFATSTFTDINRDLNKIQSYNPIVSIVIPAWNEELSILMCIASLSKTRTTIPLEIIVVNNNSTDKTQDILDKLNVKSLFQEIQGSGPSRQLGQEHAKGKYILTADADCFYPDCWVDEMMRVLQKPGVACVYGRYSFLSQPGFPRWKLAIFEGLKDLITEYRHINRPYFNAYGISMGYVKEYGLAEGFIKINRRGEDGQLCLDLMKYGKVKQVRSNKARVWTGLRTLKLDGNISKAFANRFAKEFKRFFYNLHSRLPDEKVSKK